MTSPIVFSPTDSLAFLQNIIPNYIAEEKLWSPEWLGGNPLIITDSQYEFDDIGEVVSELWKSNVKAWEYKTSKNFNFIVKPNNEVTDSEWANNSFLIYGWPDNIAKNNLIKVEDGKFIIGENSYSGETLQLSIVIPSPFNRARFVAIAMTSSSYYGGINIFEVGGYCLTRDNYKGRIEEGCLEFDNSGNEIGFKWRKQYPDDYKWLYTMSENQILCVRPDSHAQRDIDKLISIHESAYKDIISKLNIRPKNSFKILCYIDQKKTTVNHYISNKIRITYNDECKDDYSGPHELVHALTHKYFGFSKLPLLFDEGLAELLGGSSERFHFNAALLLYLKDLAPLTELFVKDAFEGSNNYIAYAQSASFVKYLISQYGWRRFIHLYKISAKCNSRTALDLFREVYNKTFVDMEKEWKAYIASFLSKNRDEIMSDSTWLAAHRRYSSKDYPGALSYIEDYLKKNSNNSEAYRMAGMAHFFMGNFEKSIDAFFKVIQFPKRYVMDHTRSYLYLGKIHDLIGKRDAAVNYYNKVLEYPEYNDNHDLARKFLCNPYKQK